MKKVLLVSLLALTSLSITACTDTLWGPSEPVRTASGQPIAKPLPGVPVKGQMLADNRNAESAAPVGGNLSTAMDSIDKSKLSHALDNPLGKATHWVNANTGINYTVTPVAKVEVNGNPFCRRYTTLAERNGKTREINGTACVNSDGTWESV